ncbi:MAG: nuclear transport factor 2 family protein [Chitinophagales bacterium]|nr:nuclear transport factor 2 family protein [Chitinophagales bacterium]
MNKVAIAKSYIEHLSNGDLEQVLSLFAENAAVNSPVYGQKNYKDFYTELFTDTNNSELSIKGIFEDTLTGNIALHFNYQWTLRNNSHVNFEVVDILEFDHNNKIKILTIIYDTVQSRDLVKDLK